MAALLTLPSCSRRPAPSLTREAFLALDNLTGDPSMAWIGQAAPYILAHDFTGVPRTLPLTVASLREAYLQNATRLVQGYYSIRSGKLHFELVVEDTSTHRMVQTTSQEGEATAALNLVAKHLDSRAKDFPASTAAAEAWGKGDFPQAVKLDPSFAMAWLSWVQKASNSGDRAQARDIAALGLSQQKLDSPIDQARLELASATLRGDDAAEIAASRRLADLVPDDPTLLTSVAQKEMAARRFADAARDYGAIAQRNPSDTSVLNQLGYAQALAGDMDAARQSFEAYGRGPGEAAVNSLDSLGEAYFLNGKFADAEREFLAVYDKSPSFLQGASLWKAAHARWLGGDLAGAETLAERYFADRTKAHDPLVVWRQATWLYETGRRQQAQDLLMHAPAGSAPLAQQQLAVWSNLDAIPFNPAQLEESYRQSDPLNDGLVRTLYAESLLKAGKTAEAKQLIRYWPLPSTNNSPLQSLVYPRFLEARKKAG